MSQQKVSDLDKRVQEFNEKLKPLLAEYNLGLSAQASIDMEGKIVANLIIFDPTKIEEEKPKEEVVKPE